MFDKVKKLEKWGVIIIFIITSLLHGLYDFTGIKLFMPISAVNESVWEHLKIGFFGGLIYAIYEYFRGMKKYKNFIFAKAVALLEIPVFIVIVFYSYKGILGKSYVIIDILIAFIAIFLSQIISCLIIASEKDYSNLKWLGLIIIISITAMFVIFTYYPPNLKIFVPS